MAETYSLAVTGQPADSRYGVSSVKVGDSVGPDGLHMAAMANNTQILCQKPDGSSAWYTLDAERSLPGAVVLKAV